MSDSNPANGNGGEEAQLQALFAERFEQLPKPLQDAIESADFERKLREIAQRHAVHIDRAAILENEVKLTLFGFEQVENLAHGIESEVGLSAKVAEEVAHEISAEIFEPIRQQLERNLEHPDAQTVAVTDTEAARAQILDEERAAAVPAVQPATPPNPAPEVKITRPTEASSYKPGEASHTRSSVHDDPYRESPV